MRTTFNTIHRNTTDGISAASERLAEFQKQVATGRRINTPSDDPSGAAQMVKERAEIATVERYERASNSVTARLTSIDTVLSDIITKLGAAQTAALSASGTVDQARRDAAAQELGGLRDALIEDFNLSFNGSRIFSGSKSTTAPFVKNPDGSVGAYQGNAAEVQIDVDRTRAVSVSFDGSSITKGPDAQDVFATLQNMITAAQTGDSATLTDGISGLKRAFARATAAQSRVGMAMNVIDDQTSRLDEQRRATVARLASIEDADMAASISGMTQAETAYRAALGAASTVARQSLLDYLR